MPQNPPVQLTREKQKTYTHLPASMAQELKALSAEIVGGETNKTDKAIRLKNFFHDHFTYSLSVNYLADDRGILAMIRERRPAYCTYFASALALLLRAEGIPARVAAGFLVIEKIGGRGNHFLARVNNAHAWTEVLLPQVDQATGQTFTTWQTLDATPYAELNEALDVDKITLEKLAEKIWLALLRSKAHWEDFDKEKLKVNFLTALIALMLLINHKKIFTAFSSILHRAKHNVSIRRQKSGQLQLIYRHYERYLKEVFNEVRKQQDTDSEVIERLRKRTEIPDETIAKVEHFLRHYHAARFGGKKSVNLKQLMETMDSKG